MFVRVTRGTAPADKLDEAIAVFRTTLLPSLATLPGYLGGMLVVDRSSGAARTLTYWEDEAALRGSEAMSAEARAQAQRSGAQTAEPESYELVLHERTVAPRPNVFVRINDVRGSIERVDDVVAFSHEQVLPSLKAQRGWLAMQAMVNRQNGRSLVMSVWDSAANREGSEAAVRLLREQGGATAGAATVEVALYEAAVVELNPAAFPVGARAPA